MPKTKTLEEFLKDRDFLYLAEIKEPSTAIIFKSLKNANLDFEAHQLYTPKDREECQQQFNFLHKQAEEGNPDAMHSIATLHCTAKNLLKWIGAYNPHDKRFLPHTARLKLNNLK